MIKRSSIILSVIMLITIVNSNAQKYLTRNGYIGFFGHATEDIKGDNNQVTAALDISKGEYAFAVLIKGFEFSRALMEEHFNENYMESDKYPKATFSGKIKDVSKVDFTKDGEYQVVVEGTLTIKDKSKTVSVPGTIIIKDGKIESKAKFNVRPEDYDIEIPSLVRDKVAKEMEVTVDVKMDLVK